jgi:uncharacterized RDD family membrane protein YckC
MFGFWNKKKDPDKNLYPSFQARLFATLLDTALAALILIPIFTLTSSVIYHDIPPSKKLSIIVSRVSKQVDNFGEFSHKLNVDPEYRKFTSEHGYKSIIIEQLIQTCLFTLAVFVFWLKKHATPGKMFLSMKIVDVKTLKEPTVFQLIVRLCSYILSVLPFGLGIFYIAFNKKHRAWHDIISGTVVVNKKELKKRLSTIEAD